MSKKKTTKVAKVKKESEEELSRKQDLELLIAPKKMQVFLTSTAYTLVSIATFGGLGYILDQQFNTKPVYFIIGLIIGYPIAQLLIYRTVKKFSSPEI